MLLLAAPPSAPGTAAALPPPLFTGAFYGVEASGGLAFADGEIGPSATMGVRAASVLQAADLAARYSLLKPGEATGHAVMVSAQLHPFFMFMLGSDRLWTTLASTYVRLGLGGAYITGGADDGLAGLWDWGAGLDAPLTDPDAGQSLWLGFEYRRLSALDGAPLGRRPVQSIELRLGWRFNAI